MAKPRKRMQEDQHFAGDLLAVLGVVLAVLFFLAAAEGKL
jgi:hypothetical protein